MKTSHRKLLLGGAALVLLGVGFFVEEHFRGQWKLESWRQRMTAQGERFVIEDCIPPPPSGENGFFDLSAAGSRLSGNAISQVAPSSFRFVSPGRVVVTRTLTEWKRNANLSRDSTNIDWRILEAELALNAEPLADAKAALRKQVFDAQLPYRMGFNIMMSHLTRLRQVAQHLNAATVQDLHLGHLDDALENIEAMLVLTRTMRDERLIISQLVRMAIASITVGATWQALQAPGWNDAQLARLQAAWQAQEFILPMAHALEMERAIGGMSFDSMRNSLDSAVNTLGLWQNMGSGNPTGTNGIRSVDDLVQYFGDNHEEILARNLYLPVWQCAWSQHDELMYLQILQTLIDGARASAKEKSLQPAANAEKELRQRLEGISGINQMRYLVVTQILPSLERAASRSVVNETQKELVIAAAALKRYEFRHGRLAPDLATLVPEFLGELPRDYCAGAPMHYRLTEDGGFQLYSVGKDGHDDGGNASPVEATSKRFSFFNSRDMVWPRPATTEEAAALDTDRPKKK